MDFQYKLWRNSLLVSNPWEIISPVNLHMDEPWHI